MAVVACGYQWIAIGTYGDPSMLMDGYWCLWILMERHWCLWRPVEAYGY